MATRNAGRITPAHVKHMKAAITARQDAQQAVELAVAAALLDGASVRQVMEATGLANMTVQRYGHAHGWPEETSQSRRATDGQGSAEPG